MKASELQAVQYLVKKELKYLHAERESLRRSETLYFSESDESTARGRLSFLFLNMTRNETRTISERIVSLDTLLKSVKNDLKDEQEYEDSLKYIII